MAQLVKMGAMLQCSFGATPATLIVTPENLTNAVKTPAATIMDFVPVKNIPPFGMCTAQTNPAVIAAKLAGSPSAPCVPVTTTPWAPGSPTVLIKGKPALSNSSKLMCTWLGVISVTQPGQFTVNVK
ncbi:MAG: DUF4280 domain-containing protein [Chloroflexota bacterium]